MDYCLSAANDDYMLSSCFRSFFVLTNAGGLFYGKGFAAEYDSLKPLLTLYRHTEVLLERAGSGDWLRNETKRPWILNRFETSRLTYL